MSDLTHAMRPPGGPPTPTTLRSPAATAVREVFVPGYEILGELGRGGVGVVYKARHLGLNRVVALKVLLGGSFAGPVERARFRLEAEAVAKLHHPNIVQVYDIGEHASAQYIALEYVDGPTVRRWQAGEGVGPAAAADLVARVARAVQHAHDAGIVHRDLKPANILLTVGSGQWVVDRGEKAAGSSLPTAHCPLPAPKVTDFGLAKAIDGGADLTGTGVACGTPNYMAPEQVRGGPRGGHPAVDVWGLGAVLFELLTGRPPFAGADAAAVMQEILRDEPPPVRAFAPQVPRDLAVVVAKCLEKNPARRYLTAAAVADDLERFAAGRPILARPVGPVRRAGRWVRRNPVPAALGAALVVGLAGTSGFAAALLRSADRERAAREDEAWQRAQAVAATRAAEAERDRAEANLAAARAERDRAEANLAAARKAAEHVVAALDRFPTEDPAVYPMYRELLEGQEPVYRQYLDQKTGDPGARAEQAELARKLGAVEGMLGSWRKARDYYKRAADAYRGLAADRPDDYSHRRMLGHCLTGAGSAAEHLGDPAAARLIREALAELAAYTAVRPGCVDGIDDTIRARLNLSGAAEVPSTEHDRAVLDLLDRREELTGPHPWVEQTRAHAWNNIASDLTDRGKTAEAEPYWRKVLAIREQQAKEHAKSRVVRYELGKCLANYAIQHGKSGRPDEAFAARVRAAALFKDLRDDTRQRGGYVGVVVRNAHDLAREYARRGDHAAALAELGPAVDLQAALVEKNPGAVPLRGLLADLHTTGAAVLGSSGRHADAAAEFRRAMELSTNPNHADHCAARVLAALVRAGDLAGAARHADTVRVESFAHPVPCAEAARGFALLAAATGDGRALGRARAAVQAAGERGYFDDPGRVRQFHAEDDFRPVWDAVPRAAR
ncbi:MAG: hypothetical protein C0501_27575 [Isosphaera sp.]|nr:hypothetical protein [Isosphaera sp.]